MIPNPTVEIKTANDKDLGLHICCEIWHRRANVDRPHTLSICLNIKNAALALRYKRAVEDGKVFIGLSIAKDADGNTYVTQKDCKVMAKYANADLKAIGY